MGSLQKLMPSLIYLLVIFPCLTLTQVSPPEGFNGSERDTLLGLKAAFNNPFLNKNWHGLHCYLNHPPLWYGIQCSNGRVVGITLEGLGLTGSVDAHALVNLSELSSLSFKNNSILGSVMDFSFNTKLIHIDLSENLFDGPISNSLLSLNNLKSMQLQGNKLTGRIPRFNQQSLTVFNISNNRLWGEIPRTVVLQLFNFSSYFGNPDLCGPPSPFTCNSSMLESAGKKKKLLSGAPLVAIIVVGDLIVLAIAVFLFVLYYKKVKSKKREKDERENEEEIRKEQKIEHGETTQVPAAREERRKLVLMDDVEGFELGDLLKASAQGLGKGNFANTYRARLNCGAEVVVKRLRDLKPLTSEEFTKQMRVLSDLKHPNVLPLLAYFYSKEEKLMVHKFAQKGSLFNRLHEGRGPSRIPFRWNSRLLVAQSIARAMEFLHVNATSQTIIPHGNLKSSNVLLDENDAVLLSDYGLASLIAVPIAAQHMTSYRAPEYQHRKKITKKADIWTLGSLLLELLTGKISNCSVTQVTNGMDLCSWVHRAVREEWTAEIFDAEISAQRNACDGLLHLLQIALRCCDKLPDKRPEMEEVVREIENIKMCDSEADSDFSFDRSLTEDSFSAVHE